MWPGVSSMLWPSWPALLGGMAAWFGMILVLALGWSLILRVLHPARPHLRLLLMLQAQAWIGRYLPAKAGLLIGKSVGARELTMRPGLVASSVLIEQLAFLSFGALVTGLVVLAQADHIGALHSALDPTLARQVVVPLLLFSAALGLVLLNALCSRSAMVKVTWIKRLAWLPLLASIYVIANTLPGLGMYILATDMGLFPGISLAEWIAVAALVNIAGMLVLFAPAGLGARELVLGFLLVEHGSSSQIILFVAGFRMLTIVADLLFYAVWGRFGFVGMVYPPTSSSAASASVESSD